MERIYFCDGTPLDILRRRAKSLKSSANVKLHAAQDQIALDSGCENWEALTKNCWADCQDPPDSGPDFCLESNIGSDGITLDFLQLFEALDEADNYDHLDLSFGCKVWLVTEVSIRDALGVTFTNVLGLRTPQHIGAKPVGEITRENYLKLKSALNLYAEDGHLGPFLSFLHSWGLFENDKLTNTVWGELDAWLTYFLREKKVRVEGRHLLNIKPQEEEDREDWDWKRAFPFLLQDGRIAVCNGSDNRNEFRYRVFTAGEWSSIESELHAAFPQGPEKTVYSETWLRKRLSMDAWDEGETVCVAE